MKQDLFHNVLNVELKKIIWTSIVLTSMKLSAC